MPTQCPNLQLTPPCQHHYLHTHPMHPELKNHRSQPLRLFAIVFLFQSNFLIVALSPSWCANFPFTKNSRMSKSTILMFFSHNSLKYSKLSSFGCVPEDTIIVDSTWSVLSYVATVAHLLGRQSLASGHCKGHGSKSNWSDCNYHNVNIMRILDSATEIQDRMWTWNATTAQGVYYIAHTPIYYNLSRIP